MSVCKIAGREDKCDLKVIMSTSSLISDSVVRWCTHCGAVVVDQDHDDRTNPGAIRPMEFPTIAKQDIK